MDERAEKMCNFWEKNNKKNVWVTPVSKMFITKMNLSFIIYHIRNLNFTSLPSPNKNFCS